MLKTWKARVYTNAILCVCATAADPVNNWYCLYTPHWSIPAQISLHVYCSNWVWSISVECGLQTFVSCFCVCPLIRPLPNMCIHMDASQTNSWAVCVCVPVATYSNRCKQSHSVGSVLIDVSVCPEVQSWWYSNSLRPIFKFLRNFQSMNTSTDLLY